LPRLGVKLGEGYDVVSAWRERRVDSMADLITVRNGKQRRIHTVDPVAASALTAVDPMMRAARRDVARPT
jgi:hypothetical protein